jgi:carboxymethylenebutenolidase
MSCENCAQGNILSGTPEGQIVPGGAYFHPAPANAAEGSSTTAIVLLTDIFGLPLVNSKIIADKLSNETGYDVWVPDLFAGWFLWCSSYQCTGDADFLAGAPPVGVDELEPLSPRKPGMTMNIGTKLKFFWLIITHIVGIISNRPSVVDARVTDVRLYWRGLSSSDMLRFSS